MFGIKRKPKVAAVENSTVTMEKTIPKKQSILEIVAEIHNSFNTAAQKVLEETVLPEAPSQQELETSSKLVAAGFTAVPLVTEVNEKNIKIAKTKSELEVISHYQQRYPQYKFIFLDQVLDLCQKYNLVLAPVHRYKGDVPLKNLEEIMNFKVLDEDKRFYFKDMIDYHNPFPQRRRYQDITSSEIINEKSYNSIHDSMRGFSSYRATIDNHYSFGVVPSYICAPEKDIIVDENSKIEKGVLMEIPDPVALHFVMKNGYRGFLIKTAWGPEASDEVVVNQKMN